MSTSPRRWWSLSATAALCGCSALFPSDDYTRGAGGGAGSSVGAGAGTGTGSGGADAFAALCAQNGVTRCMSFDEQATVASLHTLESCDPYFPECHGSVDTQTKRAGTGSLRIRLPAQVNPDDVGWLGVNFTDGSINEPPTGPYPVQFGTGETFYVAWEQRISSGMLSDSLGSSGWYGLTVGPGDQEGVAADTLSPFFIGVGVDIGFGAVRMYANLWRADACSMFSDLSWQNMFGAPVFQNLTGCEATPPGSERCENYVADAWMAFQLAVDVGAWGQSNTRVRLWVAREAEPPILVIDDSIRLCSDDETNAIRFGKLWLNPSVTDRTPQPEDAFTWYDNLVVSTTPILAGT